MQFSLALISIKNLSLLLFSTSKSFSPIMIRWNAQQTKSSSCHLNTHYFNELTAGDGSEHAQQRPTQELVIHPYTKCHQIKSFRNFYCFPILRIKLYQQEFHRYHTQSYSIPRHIQAKVSTIIVYDLFSIHT
jgi:hypothetical protein